MRTTECRRNVRTRREQKKKRRISSRWREKGNERERGGGRRRRREGEKERGEFSCSRIRRGRIFERLARAQDTFRGGAGRSSCSLNVNSASRSLTRSRFKRQVKEGNGYEAPLFEFRGERPKSRVYKSRKWILYVRNSRECNRNAFLMYDMTDIYTDKY